MGGCFANLFLKLLFYDFNSWYGNVDELQDKGYTGKEGEFNDIDLSGASDDDLQNQPAADVALNGSGGAGAEGAGEDVTSQLT